jgi:RHS repeat-associated protein
MNYSILITALSLVTGHLLALVTSSWDEQGRIASISIEGYGAVSYTYEDNLLSHILRTADDGSTWYQVELAYDENRGLIEEVFRDAYGELLYQNDASRPYRWADRLEKTAMPVVQEDSSEVVFVQEGDVRKKYVRGQLIETYWSVSGEEIAIFDGEGRLVELKIPGLPLYPTLSKPAAIEKGGQVFYPMLAPDLSIVALKDVMTKEVLHNPPIDAYGKILLSLPVVSRFSYRGKVYDATTQTVFFSHRTFDLKTSRWLSPDPCGAIQSEDLYAYCHDEPEKYLDPDGRFFTVIPLYPLITDMTTTLISIGTILVVSSIEQVAKEVNLYLEKRSDKKKAAEFIKKQQGQEDFSRKSFSPDI